VDLRGLRTPVGRRWDVAEREGQQLALDVEQAGQRLRDDVDCSRVDLLEPTVQRAAVSLEQGDGIVLVLGSIPAVGGDLKRTDELDPADAWIGVGPPERIRVLTGRTGQRDGVEPGKPAVPLEPRGRLLDHRGLGDSGQHRRSDRLGEDRSAVRWRERATEGVTGREALAYDASRANATCQGQRQDGGGLITDVPACPTTEVELLAQAAWRLFQQMIAVAEDERLRCAADATAPSD
jgi:hypothetical protein